jgi:branched-subunit amino acid aminotransferase/4-amino-4-deoxychorismate lyase
MELSHIDRLLKTLKSLEIDTYRCNREIARNQRLLENTVNSRVKILRELANYGIRNTFDLRVYLSKWKLEEGRSASLQ